MIRGVRDAEDVADIVGRVQGKEAEEGGGTPDLGVLVMELSANHALLTFTIGSVALEKSSA